MAPPTRRRGGGRRIGKRILIICEGERDEYGYLRTARSSLRLSKANVVIESAKGGSPSSIIAKAEKHLAANAGRHSEEAFDAIWVVLDAERPATSGVTRAAHEAFCKNIGLALSNPCFEVWLLLHLREHAAPLTAAQAKRAVKQAFGITSRRGNGPVFDDPRLRSDWRVAQTNALARRAALTRDSNVADATSHRLVLAGNPATNLDELLVALDEARPGLRERQP